jgi:hypothetical protein
MTYTKPEGATLVATAYGTGSGWYHIERHDGEPSRNRWRLVYPGGGYERTSTKKEALRLLRLHADALLEKHNADYAARVREARKE